MLDGYSLSFKIWLALLAFEAGMLVLLGALSICLVILKMVH